MIRKIVSTKWRNLWIFLIMPIVIVDKQQGKENVLAGYDRKNNVLFVRSDLITDNEIIRMQQLSGRNYFAHSDKTDSSLIHELGHWYQWNKAKAEYSYMSDLELKTKIRDESDRLVEILNKKGYNIRKEISEYAGQGQQDMPEEVFAEKFVDDYYKNR